MTWLHEHAWVPAGHVMRCGDPDCTSWVPLPLTDPAAVAPAELPPRQPKPKATPHPKAAVRKARPTATPAAGSNVMPLTRNRKAT